MCLGRKVGEELGFPEGVSDTESGKVFYGVSECDYDLLRKAGDGGQQFSC